MVLSYPHRSPKPTGLSDFVSAMKPLRSSVASDSDTIDASDPVLEGLYGAEGFFFQKRVGRLNIREISSLDVDKLIREVDIDILQQHIENIAFAKLKEEDIRYMTDAQLIKFFQIAQLIIEYLLYSQEQIVKNLDELSKKYSGKKRYAYAALTR